jgi:cytochrome bd ubiquinol oxidase subunit II
MSQSTLATLAAALAWVALIAYAVLGGADFGGGIWDLLPSVSAR